MINKCIKTGFISKNLEYKSCQKVMHLLLIVVYNLEVNSGTALNKSATKPKSDTWKGKISYKNSFLGLNLIFNNSMVLYVR